MRTGIVGQDRLRWLAALACAVALAALVLQYAILVRSTLQTVGPAFATLRFFSYFTVLSNVLVVLVAGRAAFAGVARASGFLDRDDVRAAVALYIGVTGTIYVLILRHLWQPQGLQWWADSGLHYASPLLYLGWWMFGARHGALRWRDGMRWLLFPLAYLLWSFLRGAWVHEYPYPFIDVDALGWARVLRNAVGVLGVFLLGGAGLLGLDAVLGRTRGAWAQRIGNGDRS